MISCQEVTAGEWHNTEQSIFTVCCLVYMVQYASFGHFYLKLWNFQNFDFALIFIVMHPTSSYISINSRNTLDIYRMRLFCPCFQRREPLMVLVCRSLSRSLTHTLADLSSVQSFTVPFSPIPYCIVMYGPVWSQMVSYGPLWSLIVPYGPIGPRRVLYGPVWSRMVPYYYVWSCMVNYDPIWSSRIPQGPLLSPVFLYSPLGSHMIHQSPVWSHKVPQSPRIPFGILWSLWLPTVQQGPRRFYMVPYGST